MQIKDRYWPRRNNAELPGIDLRAQQQLDLLDEFAQFIPEMPITDDPADGRRYGFKNRFFAHGDGTVLYCMLRLFAPTKVVEVGSGWSSALMLDVVEQHGGTKLAFIEPYTERLDEFITDSERESAEVFAMPLQEVSEDVIGSLGSGDILFIDSTHVSRIGSDVNQLLLDVIPRLPDGVLVHIHDIFFPFEYPEVWVKDGRAWNETYMLHASLINNPNLHIVWFNSYLAQFHRERVAQTLPTWDKNPGGSIWLRTGKAA